MNKSPKTWIILLLRSFIHPEHLEEIEGDILELFDHYRKTDRRFPQFITFLNVIRAFQWKHLKSFRPKLISGGLVQGFIKVGIRNGRKDLVYTMLNALGLSVGFALFFIMVEVLYHEYSYDHFHKDSERSYEIVQVFENIEGEDPEIWTPYPLAESIKSALPSAESVTNIHAVSTSWVEAGGQRYLEEEGIVAGPDFNEIFTFEVLKGKLNLASPYSILITKDLAIKYFGSIDVIGESISIEKYGIFTIQAVLNTIPSNSFIQFNFVISQNYDTYFKTTAPWFQPYFQSWSGNVVATFVKLQHKGKKETFEKQATELLAKNIPEGSPNHRLYLLPLTELHFGSNGIDGSVNRYKKSDEYGILIFAAICIIILLISIVNFISLNSSRIIWRHKEMGIRKLFGAKLSAIQFQFLIEFIIQSLFALFFSALLYHLSAPYFEQITGVHLGQSIISLPTLLLLGFLLMLVSSLLISIYPTIQIKALSTVRILKSTPKTRENNRFRKVLFGIQFSIVFMLVSSWMLLHKQYQYVTDKDLGYETDHTMVIEINGPGVRNNFQTLKNEFQRLPEVKNVMGITRMIGGHRTPVGIFCKIPETQETVPMRFFGMDEAGISGLGLKLTAGRNFINRSADSLKIIVNQSAAAKMGIEPLIGTKIQVYSEDNTDENVEIEIIGIVEDFHFNSLHQSIEPLALGYISNPFQGIDDIVIKMHQAPSLSTINKIEEIHNQFDENDHMTWSYLDTLLKENYSEESKYISVLNIASFLGVIIIVFGLISGISYEVYSTLKNTAIKKVFGANFREILQNDLYKDLFPTFLTWAIVTPLLWLAFNEWLENFAFHTEVTIDLFLIPYLLYLIIGTITHIAIQLQASKRNVIDLLREE